MSLVPTSQCITDCSILNQSTCAPASPRPRTIVNYHMVSVHDLKVIMVVMNYLNTCFSKAGGYFQLSECVSCNHGTGDDNSGIRIILVFMTIVTWWPFVSHGNDFFSDDDEGSVTDFCQVRSPNFCSTKFGLINFLINVTKGISFERRLL